MLWKVGFEPTKERCHPCSGFTLATCILPLFVLYGHNVASSLLGSIGWRTNVWIHQVVLNTFLIVCLNETPGFSSSWACLVEFNYPSFRQMIETTSLSYTPLLLSAYMPSVHPESTFACFPMVTTTRIELVHPVLEKLLFSHWTKLWYTILQVLLYFDFLPISHSWVVCWNGVSIPVLPTPVITSAKLSHFLMIL